VLFDTLRWNYQSFSINSSSSSSSSAVERPVANATLTEFLWYSSSSIFCVNQLKSEILELKLSSHYLDDQNHSSSVMSEGALSMSSVQFSLLDQHNDFQPSFR
jgi:hypothetical protein